MKMEQTECSEMLAYKIQAPGNYPEESIQHLFYFPQNYIYFIILFCLLKLYIFSQTVDCNLNTHSCQLTVKVYLVVITNKMQLGNGIYYFSVH